MDRMKDKVVIVTGGARGRGGAACAAPASEGAADVVADILEDAGQQTVAEIERSGGRARFARLDVRDADAWSAVVSETVDAFGGRAGRGRARCAEVHPAALPAGAEQDCGNRGLQTGVGIEDDQLGAGQAGGLERAQERRPERPVLRIADGEAEVLLSSEMVTTACSGCNPSRGGPGW